MSRHDGKARHEAHAAVAGDWRARMVLRGGPVAHAVARSGWALFGAAGAAVMIVVSVLYTLSPGERGADNSPAANLIGSMILFLPAGGVLMGLIGLGAQFAVRAWLRAPTDAERTAARQAEVHTSLFVDSGLRSSGRWARMYHNCARSATAYHAIVAALAEGPGRTWFAEVGETLDGELAEALRLARLGESLETGSTELSPTALRVADLLRDAERSFADTKERAAAIALDLRDESDFVRVRTQLDMLTQQAPHLRAHGVD